MTTQDLQNITLQTPVYHPFLGKGYPTKISSESIHIKFGEGVCADFGIRGSVADGHFLSHLYLTPIKIVEQ